MIYPIVVVQVEGIKCRALLDTGAGSSWASNSLLELIKKKPIRKEYKRIEMMMTSTTRVMEVYDLEISDINNQFRLTSEIIKVDRQVLLTVPNPEYKNIIEKYPHLKGVKMDDDDRKANLPIHVILGASDYSRNKTRASAKLGGDGQPVAEKTKLGVG